MLVNLLKPLNYFVHGCTKFVLDCNQVSLIFLGNFPAISDDLVNSYHLLLCCLDWFFANVLLSNRRDLLNPDFSGWL